MSRRKEATIPNERLDQLLVGGAASEAFEQGGLLDSLKRALTQRALNAEMDYHLAGDEDAGNTRNGYGRKTVLTDSGQLSIDVPRDRQASFEPQLIAKYQRRFPGFDDKIVSMYARGMSTREFAGHLHELYGIDVSADLISTVTDAVLDEVATWQQRPLDPVYPLVFFDAIRVKIRDEGIVRNKAIHIALGVRANGSKEVLGLWLEQNEGAKFWLRVMNELRNRGTEGISCWPSSTASKASLTRSPRCSPTQSSRPASSTSCATRWTLRHGKTARRWPARLRAVTAPPIPSPLKRR